MSTSSKTINKSAHTVAGSAATTAAGTPAPGVNPNVEQILKSIPINSETALFMRSIIKESKKLDDATAKMHSSATTDQKKRQEALTSQLLPMFIKTLKALLQALTSVFPKCVNTRQTLDLVLNDFFEEDVSAYESTSSAAAPKAGDDKNDKKPKYTVKSDQDSLVAQSALIRTWDNVMQPFYSDVLKGIHGPVFKTNKNVHIFLHLELYKKFYDPLFKHNQATLLHYINHLNAFACFYCSIPAHLLETFERMGKEIEDEVKNSHAEDGSELTYEQVKEISTRGIMKRMPDLVKRITDAMKGVDEMQIQHFMDKVPVIMEFMQKVPSLEKVLHATGLKDHFMKTQSNIAAASAATKQTNSNNSTTQPPPLASSTKKK